MLDSIDPFQHKHSDAPNGGTTALSINGLHCTFNMPNAVQRQYDGSGKEVIAGLPPYAPRIGYPVDRFPASPASWMHGSGKASSYFVPIVPEHGMWLDFNANQHHSHHVAVVVSVQGINPLTGMKTDPIRLEQYRERCPKHNEEFRQNRYCPSCQFEWHPQNYLSSNAGGPFWVDGFRTEEGVIRQWYFTEEECKGVAAQLIGNERVFAIGIAFYLSKQPKPPVVVRRTRGYGSSIKLCSAGPFLGSSSTGFKGFAPSYESQIVNHIDDGHTFVCDSLSSEEGVLMSCPPDGYEPLGDVYNNQRLGSFEAEQASIERSVKKIEIGAGAKIHQTIGADPEKLDFWQDEPAGMIYINYCDVATASRILAAGQRKTQAEGFLGGLKLKD